MPTSEARKRACKKYEQEKIDRIPASCSQREKSSDTGTCNIVKRIDKCLYQSPNQ